MILLAGPLAFNGCADNIIDYAILLLTGVLLQRDPDAMLRNADVAMRQAENDGHALVWLAPDTPGDVASAARRAEPRRHLPADSPRGSEGAPSEP